MVQIRKKMTFKFHDKHMYRILENLIDIEDKGANFQKPNSKI